VGKADRRGALNYLTPDRRARQRQQQRCRQPAEAGVDFPVHVLAIRALGLHLLDYLRFETLLPLCETHGQWSFLCVIAPLRLPNGTGSPINPIAVL
jgi:hypothetical protein